MAYSFNTELKSIAAKYIELLQAKVTVGTIKKDIEENPYYPSLLALSDTFSRYKIDNKAYKIPAQDFTQFDIEIPYVAFMKIPDIGNDFVLVTHVTEKTISYIHKGKKIKTLSKEEFQQQFQDIVWIAKATEKSGELEYDKKLKLEKNKKKSKIALIGAGILALLLIIIANTPNNNIFSYGLITMFKTIGSTSAILLLIYEIDKNNAFVKNVCSISTKTNCDAVLGSKAAKIGGISWGEIGFLYFAATTIGLFMPNLSFETKITCIAFANACVVPYIFYSLYYQAKVIKQWCLLCLVVQAVLFVEFLWSIAFVWQYPLTDIVQIQTFLIAIFCLLVPTVIWYGLKTTFIKAQDHDLYKAAYKRLQYNPEIFNSLLQKETQAPDGWQTLGIDIGNPTAKNTVIKICNPYCGPCDKAHPQLEDIIQNNQDIKLKIIYITRNNEYEKGRFIVRHLLAISEKNDRIKMQEALDDWYMNVGKNYEIFAKKHPMNGELEKQHTKIEAMSQWCDIANVTHTPTIFVNGYRLPENYTIEELKYIL